MFKKQSGAVLVISLIILIVLTLLVVSGTQSTIMQKKMTAAVRDAHISLAEAESGILDAENVVENLLGVVGFSDTGIAGKYNQNNGPVDLFANAVWVDNLTSAATTDLSGTGRVARYFIEYLGVLSSEQALSGLNIAGYGETAGGGDVHAFKIVSRSVGRDGNTERIIVSYYGKRF